MRSSSKEPSTLETSRVPLVIFTSCCDAETAVVNPRGGCDYLTWQRSTVKTPYRNTKRPTRAAGNSIPVYQPSQAKYRPIFSPKYLLERRNPGGIGRTEGKKVVALIKKLILHVPQVYLFSEKCQKRYLMTSSGWYLYQAPHQAQHSYSRCRWFSAPCVLTEFLLWYFPWHGKTCITHCLVRVI